MRDWMKRLGAAAALLGVLILAAGGIGWGEQDYHWHKAIWCSAAGTTAVYFPPRDSTSYATYHRVRPKDLFIAKSSGTSIDSIFAYSDAFPGGVSRVPFYAFASVIWQTHEWEGVKQGIDSLYIHSAGAGTFHLIARD